MPGNAGKRNEPLIKAPSQDNQKREESYQVLCLTLARGCPRMGPRQGERRGGKVEKTPRMRCPQAMPLSLFSQSNLFVISYASISIDLSIYRWFSWSNKNRTANSKEFWISLQLIKKGLLHMIGLPSYMAPIMHPLPHPYSMPTTSTILGAGWPKSERISMVIGL